MSHFPETYVPGFHDEASIRRMQYNELGDTGLKVSKLSLGTGGFSYFYGDYDIDECKKIVYEALKRGINFIDTAPWYGHGVSEEILGKCLEGIPREAYYLATKVCRYEADPKLMFDFSANKTRASINDSLRRLKLNYVDILQIHDIEFAPNLDMVLNETLPTVEEIVKSGKARFIGVTGYPLSTISECIKKTHVKINTVLSYCRMTMIDNTLKQYLPLFKSHKIGVINAAANSMGLLSNAGPPNWHPAPEHIRAVCEEAQEYCKKSNVELGKLAVHYSLQQEGPATTLVGMTSTKYLEYNFDVLYNGLSEKELKTYDEVNRILSKLKHGQWENVELEKYWKTLRDSKGV